MVKRTKKPTKTKSNTINSVLADNKTPPKSRQQIYQESYQKNKAKKKAQQKLNYAKKKEQQKAQSTKYYQATNIKILLTLKEYTELNQQKRKLWLDFTATLHQLSQGITTIEEIMRLRELTDNLIRDCQETAKKEVQKGKSWNNLDYDQQQKLIRYWGYEKARIENNLLTTAEQLKRQSQEYLKDIESAKFHEERGRIKCECYRCARKAREYKVKLKRNCLKSKRQIKNNVPNVKSE